MTDKPLREQQHGVVYFRDATSVDVIIEDVDDIHRAMTERLPFTWATGIYGQSLYVRLSEVSMISKWYQATCDAIVEENEKDKDRKLLGGDDD